MTTNLDISKDIHSLTEFKRNTAELTEHMKESGRPLVLTVNGKAEFVVQDAASYQAMAEAYERAAVIEGVRRGLEQMERGDVKPASEVFKNLRARHGFSGETDAEATGE